MYTDMLAAMRGRGGTSSSGASAHARVVEDGARLVAVPPGPPTGAPSAPVAPTDAKAGPARGAAAQTGDAGDSSRANGAPGGAAELGSAEQGREEEEEEEADEDADAPLGGLAAVLQMPRGNLEAVRPRALVLPALVGALDAGSYGLAWRLAAENRLDLNVLVDHAWPAFLARAPAFVAAVGDDQALGDLLAALRPGSVAAPGGLYAALLPAAPSPRPIPDASGLGAWPGSGYGGSAEAEQAGDAGAAAAPAQGAPHARHGAGPESGPAPEHKVAAVARALRDAMRAAGPRAYLRPLLTSHVVLGELEAALALVRDAKEADLAREAGGGQGPGPGAPASGAGRGTMDGGATALGASAVTPHANGGAAHANGGPAAAESGTSHQYSGPPPASGNPAAREGPMELQGAGALGVHRRAVPRAPPSAEDGMRHLLLTVDVERLYRAVRSARGAIRGVPWRSSRTSPGCTPMVICLSLHGQKPSLHCAC